MFEPTQTLGGETEIIDAEDPEIEHLKEKRGKAQWFVVAGMAGLFLGVVSTNIALGGVAMIGWGVIHYARYSIKMKKVVDDPWKDKEIDEWEKEFHDA
jgi:hypothetical protein